MHVARPSQSETLKLKIAMAGSKTTWLGKKLSELCAVFTHWTYNRHSLMIMACKFSFRTMTLRVYNLSVCLSLL